MRATIVGIAAVLAGCRGTVLGYQPPPPGTDARVGLGGIHASVSAALRDDYRGRAARPAPPLALVPTDGTELVLAALAATVQIEGPIAHTELRFTFHNPEERRREGRFSIDLPADAAVGRFAMKIASEWREARVVTRERGREVYEQVLHRGLDPALLEQDLAHRFSARVFPIEPRADKELVIAYDERVGAGVPYTLALAGLPVIPSLRIAIEQDGAARVIDRSGAPPEDVVVPVAGGADAVAADDAFVVRIDPERAGEGAAAPLDRVMILVDTSASRAPLMLRQAELVRGLVAVLPADATVVVAAFDHAVTELYRGRAGAAAAAGAAAGALLEHGALGASDLGSALRRAAGAGMARVVIVGDGAPTLGERDPSRLAAIVAGAGLERVDAIRLGASLERDTLAAITGAGRARGAILDGRSAARVAQQLARPVPAMRPIRVDGALASFPATTRGLAPGAPIWVAGRRAPGAGPITVRIGDRTVEVAPRRAEAARVRRAVARAELAVLTEQRAAAAPADRPALDARIEQLALAHDLVSARTSLLVLESDEDERLLLTAAERGAPAAPARPRAPAVPSAVAAAPTLAAPTRAPAAPAIDRTSTSQGIVITREYLHNVPVPAGRTFDEVLGESAGRHPDGGAEAIVISGSTTLHNTYYVEGINTVGRHTIVQSGGMSPLHAEVYADAMRATAAPFGFTRDPDALEAPKPSPPYTGELRAIMAALAAGDRDAAVERAARWQLASPGEVAAILALGEALEARGAAALAARVYGSLIDLYPNRAELLRAAGERLDRVAASHPAARALAIDAYRRALDERPDHVSTYRLLAYALVRAGRGVEAIDLLGTAIGRASRPSVVEILAGDAGLIAAHVVARDPAQRDRLAPRMLRGIADRPSLRVVLSWETDANDVDLHIFDRRGHHAWYRARELASGGALLDDLTDGYGPEMFAVDHPTAFPYRVAAHYYRRGPMGIGLGTVQVIRHDGAGNLAIEDRPFAIQVDGATIDLGAVGAL